MLIKELMAKNLTTLVSSETVESAARKMIEHGISGAPVLDDKGRLVGILSDTDILKHMKTVVDDEVGMRYLSGTEHALSLFLMLAEKDHEVRDSVLKRLRTAQVGKAMTKHVITAKPNATIEAVAALMIQNNINRIPIMENGKLIGMVTKSDFARFVATGLPR